MAHRHPCYRHPRSVWIAACPDCTAWHQATAAAAREAAPEPDRTRTAAA
jgi:hypothetical protein